MMGKIPDKTLKKAEIKLTTELIGPVPYTGRGKIFFEMVWNTNDGKNSRKKNH